MAAGAVSREDLVAETRRGASSSDAFREWTLAAVDVMHVVAQNGALEDARIFQAPMEARRRQAYEEHSPAEQRARKEKMVR